jgi:hypothetical protein
MVDKEERQRWHWHRNGKRFEEPTIIMIRFSIGAVPADVLNI